MIQAMPKSVIGGGALAFTLLLAASASAFPVDLQMRATAIPNSCDYALFEPELKITNVTTFDILLSSVFVEFAFNAGLTEIEAVHPRITVPIFNAAGGVVSWTFAEIRQTSTFSTFTFAPDRRGNQVWAVVFDPPSPPPNPSNAIPPGGYATVIPTLRRAGGAIPFDVGCDDFSKVDRGTSQITFIDNRFMHLIFTSTQQLICEQKSPTTNDPLTGLAFGSVPITGCSN
jgi:hypothetical protein